MSASGFIAKAERDAMLVDRINRALHGMCLFDGRTILMEGEHITVDLALEREALREALRLLSINPDEVLPAPYTRKD
jgi:hypothetical protein